MNKDPNFKAIPSEQILSITEVTPYGEATQDGSVLERLPTGTLNIHRRNFSGGTLLVGATGSYKFTGPYNRSVSASLKSKSSTIVFDLQGTMGASFAKAAKHLRGVQSPLQIFAPSAPNQSAHYDPVGGRDTFDKARPLPSQAELE